MDCWRPDDRRVHTWPHPPATERRLVMVNRSIIKNLALEPFKSLMLQVLNDCTHASSNRNSRSVALHACFGWIASETLKLDVNLEESRKSWRFSSVYLLENIYTIFSSMQHIQDVSQNRGCQNPTIDTGGAAVYKITIFTILLVAHTLAVAVSV